MMIEQLFVGICRYDIDLHRVTGNIMLVKLYLLQQIPLFLAFFALNVAEKLMVTVLVH